MLYPSIPGELDLPLLVAAAASARTDKKGIWSDSAALLAYDYRAMKKLYAIMKRIVDGEEVRGCGRLRVARTLLRRHAEPSATRP